MHVCYCTNGHVVYGEVPNCPYCGSDLLPEGAPRPVSGLTVRHCAANHIVRGDFFTCPICGKETFDGPPSGITEERALKALITAKPKQLLLRRLWGIVGILFLAAIVIAVAFPHGIFGGAQSSGHNSTGSWSSSSGSTYDMDSNYSPSSDSTPGSQDVTAPPVVSKAEYLDQLQGVLQRFHNASSRIASSSPDKPDEVLSDLVELEACAGEILTMKAPQELADVDLKMKQMAYEV